MKNREIKFRIWFNEPGAPPQMIYPHIDDFIYDQNISIIFEEILIKYNEIIKQRRVLVFEGRIA